MMKGKRKKKEEFTENVRSGSVVTFVLSSCDIRTSYARPR